MSERVNKQYLAGKELIPFEIMILDDFRQGLTRNDIAKKHGYSIENIDYYLQKIYAKLQVRSIVQAVNKCWELGIFKRPIEVTNEPSINIYNRLEAEDLFSAFDRHRLEWSE